MNNKLITYNVSKLLSNSSTRSALLDYNYNWDYVEDYYTSYGTSALVITPRAGINNLPFVLENNVLDYTMPDYDANFNKTFAEITDETALDVLKNLPPNKKLMIYWSGGIDSQIILTAVLKNWSEADIKDKLVVGMNNFSIYENPYFYYKFIKDRVQTVNSFDPPDYENYISVFGEPEMPSTSSKKYLSIMSNYPGIYNELISNSVSKYIDHYTMRVNRNFAETNAEKLLENIESINGKYPIETIGDFIWWENFNWTWKGIKGGVDRVVSQLTVKLDMKVFLTNNFYWYDTLDYQRWIMKNKGYGVTYGRDPGYIKRVHKEYIYEFDKNPHYLEYKSKLPGGALRPDPKFDITMITEDYRTLTLEDDLDEILKYIPEIVNIS